MYKPGKQTKPHYPTPVGVDLQGTFAQVNAHFVAVVTPKEVIASRNTLYATIINSTTDVDTTPLVQRVGTEEAKKMTETILTNILKPISTVVTTVPSMS